MQVEPGNPIELLQQKSRFARKMLAWFQLNRRDLPWRTKSGAAPDPYHVFISEAMLQQTQVATVTGYFLRFLHRFPTLQSLADADEQEVLRLWQGLGYYSRARNLRKAAIQVMQSHGGNIPENVEDLLRLSGIGRYTAGAIASIAHGQRVPLLDGNVARALCRLCAIRTDPREKKTSDALWSIAHNLLPLKNCGAFNESLMELGATICTPRKPNCPACPVRTICQAYEQGIQQQIPPPKRAKPTPLEHRWTFVIVDRKGRLLIEQRPAKGRWAGMWQFPTVPAGSSSPEDMLQRLNLVKSFSVPTKLGEVTHQLTHRRYRFEAFAAKGQGKSGVWVTRDELKKYPMSKPQLSILRFSNEG